MFRLRHKKSAWLLQVFPSKIVPTPFGAAYTDRDIPPLLWKTNDFPPISQTKKRELHHISEPDMPANHPASIFENDSTPMCAGPAARCVP